MCWADAIFILCVFFFSFYCVVSTISALSVFSSVQQIDVNKLREVCTRSHVCASELCVTVCAVVLQRKWLHVLFQHTVLRIYDCIQSMSSISSSSSSSFPCICIGSQNRMGVARWARCSLHVCVHRASIESRCSASKRWTYCWTNITKQMCGNTQRTAYSISIACRIIQRYNIFLFL